MASKENLFVRKCAISKVCPICDFPYESIHHCLFACPHAAEGWNQEWPSLPRPAPLSSFLKWLDSLRQSYPIISIQKIIFLGWQTWKTRNEKIFRDTKPWPPSTITRAASAHLQWTTCPRKVTTGPPSTQLISPQEHSSSPPGTHDFEVHCDGSFFDEPQKAAYGVVVSNNHGQVCGGRAESMHCFPPLEAEALALLEGSRLAVSLKAPCLVKFDCLQLVNAVHSHPKSWPWRAAARLGLIKRTLEDNPLVKIQHFSRRNNSKANWVGRSCARNQLPSQ